jgi:hypothetical protein
VVIGEAECCPCALFSQGWRGRGDRAARGSGFDRGGRALPRCLAVQAHAAHDSRRRTLGVACERMADRPALGGRRVPTRVAAREARRPAPGAAPPARDGAAAGRGKSGRARERKTQGHQRLTRRSSLRAGRAGRAPSPTRPTRAGSPGPVPTSEGGRVAAAPSTTPVPRRFFRVENFHPLLSAASNSARGAPQRHGATAPRLCFFFLFLSSFSRSYLGRGLGHDGAARRAGQGRPDGDRGAGQGGLHG